MSSREYDRPRTLGGKRRAVLDQQAAKLKAEARAEYKAECERLNAMADKGPWWRKPSNSGSA